MANTAESVRKRKQLKICRPIGLVGSSPTRATNLYNRHTMKNKGEIFILELSGHLKKGKCIYMAGYIGDIDTGIVVEDSYEEDGTIWAEVNVFPLYVDKYRPLAKQEEIIEWIPANVLGIEL